VVTSGAGGHEPPTVRPEATFTATLWRYPGDAGWYFVTLPLELADDIRASSERHGFGSVRVSVTTGSSTWATSVFPDSDSGSFVLPVKSAVRRSEGLDDGSDMTVSLVVL
jgi:hypothetical protein